MLSLFDGPDGGLPCGKRKETIVPTQALALMNSQFVRKKAERLAERLMDSNENLGRPDQKLVNAVFIHTLSRPPSEKESELTLGFLTRVEHEKGRRPALIDFCHVMLMSNEFIYVD